MYIAQRRIISLLPTGLKRIYPAFHVALLHREHHDVVHDVVVVIGITCVTGHSVTGRMFFSNQGELLCSQMSDEFLVIRPMNGVFARRSCLYYGFIWTNYETICLHEGGNACGANVERREMRHEVVAQHETQEYVVHYLVFGSRRIGCRRCHYMLHNRRFKLGDVHEIPLLFIQCNIDGFYEFGGLAIQVDTT